MKTLADINNRLAPPLTITVTNIDDIIRQAFVWGERELSVSTEQMGMIVQIYISILGQTEVEGAERLRILQEGVITRLFGVQLYLI